MVEQKKEQFVTIGYCYKDVNLSKQYDEKILREKYQKKCIKKFKNHNIIMTKAYLKRAYDNFEVFLEKLKNKIFDIKIPENVSPLVATTITLR